MIIAHPERNIHTFEKSQKTENETAKKRKKTYAKMQFNDFEKRVNLIPDGAITPKKLGMEDQRRLFYNWIADMPNIKKINGRYYKVTDRNEEAEQANG